MQTLRVPRDRQGQPGMGQGGYTSFKFAQATGETVTVALKRAIPLETDLQVVRLDDRWQLVDPSAPTLAIMEATLWQPDYAATEPVALADAERARAAFQIAVEDHPAPNCASCGLQASSLQVHAGPLGDGRWATPFRLPESSLIGGEVDLSLLSMAMDCSCGWYISNSSPEPRDAVTVQFAVDVLHPIQPETDYALVAWHGDYSPGWDGRKRGAAAAMFDAAGTCVAQSKSFWVAT